jgi:hypothetical protein
MALLLWVALLPACSDRSASLKKEKPSDEVISPKQEPSDDMPSVRPSTRVRVYVAFSG